MKQELVQWEKEEEAKKEGKELEELRTKSTPEKVSDFYLLFNVWLSQFVLMDPVISGFYF